MYHSISRQMGNTQFLTDERDFPSRVGVMDPNRFIKCVESATGENLPNTDAGVGCIERAVARSPFSPNKTQIHHSNTTTFVVLPQDVDRDDEALVWSIVSGAHTDTKFVCVITYEDMFQHAEHSHPLNSSRKNGYCELNKESAHHEEDKTISLVTTVYIFRRMSPEEHQEQNERKERHSRRVYTPFLLGERSMELPPDLAI
jgi:hypothetical protein